MRPVDHWEQSATIACGGSLSGWMLRRNASKSCALQRLYSSFKLTPSLAPGGWSAAALKCLPGKRAVLPNGQGWSISKRKGWAEAEAGAAFTWRREGDCRICDTLTIYRSGWAAPVSCKAGKEGDEVYRLSPNELEQLYDWPMRWRRSTMKPGQCKGRCDAGSALLVGQRPARPRPRSRRRLPVLPGRSTQTR